MTEEIKTRFDRNGFPVFDDFEYKKPKGGQWQKCKDCGGTGRKYEFMDDCYRNCSVCHGTGTVFNRGSKT
jgi:DnaJ-class molecular chaperone